jgi:hypothetical protein
MRVFSSSQGKIIDVPDTQTGNVGGVVTTPEINIPQNSVSQDQIKKLTFADLISTGGKNLTKINTIKDLLSPEQGNADQRKNQVSFNATQSLVNTLEQRFSQAKGGEYSGLGALIGGTRKNLSAKLGLDDPAKVYNAEKEGFAATLKQLTGDTGVLTDQDYARLSKLLPSFTDSAEVAKAKFGDLRKQMASRFGGVAAQSQYVQPEQKGGALAALFPSTAEYLREGQKGYQEAVGQFRTSGDYGQYAKDVALLGLKDQFLPNTKKLSAGLELAPLVPAGLGIGSRLLGGTSSVGESSLLSKVLHPFKTVGEQRAAAIAEASGKTISGDKMVAALKRVVNQVPSTEKKEFLQELAKAEADYAGKSINIKDAVALNTHLNDAYLASGKVGKSAKALVEKTLGDVVKKEFNINAPAVAKANEWFSRLYSIKDLTKKVAPAAVVGGAASAAVYSLFDKLRGR